jgi:hypothetical protein
MCRRAFTKLGGVFLVFFFSHLSQHACNLGTCQQIRGGTSCYGFIGQLARFAQAVWITENRDSPQPSQPCFSYFKIAQLYSGVPHLAI